jgi:hypothetical protein
VAPAPPSAPEAAEDPAADGPVPDDAAADAREDAEDAEDPEDAEDEDGGGDAAGAGAPLI